MAKGSVVLDFKPHGYQETAIQKILDTPKAGLFLDMGLGKTVITLTAISKLMWDYFDVEKVLVIAPKRVAEDVWSTECDKWSHLNGIKISKVLGTAKQRRLALALKADIYVINRENVVWLTNELSGIGNGWGFDMVVIDELSSFKSAKSQRFKALKKFIPRSSRVVGLTGTPAPNGLIDLWSQIYLLDAGERLGKTITGFRERYFVPKERNGATVFKYAPKPETERAIEDKLSDICISMSAKDWLELPEKVDNICALKFSDQEYARYKEFEKNSYLEFLEGGVTAATKGVLIGKLLQYCNGAVYLDNGFAKTNDKKIEELAEIVELANGKPVLCFYSFRHDLERIQTKLPFAQKLGGQRSIDAWNKGEIPLLLAHPASAGHGLNLQYAGNIMVWFGLTWSLELYQQANARLYRQGQTQSVIINHLIMKDTVEEKVLSSLFNKAVVQDTLLESLKAEYGQ